MEWNNDIFEESNMFIPERHCKARDDAGQDIQEFRGAIKLESLVYETIETVIDGFPYHLPPGHKFGIQSM